MEEQTTETALLVEDDPSLRKLVKGYLSLLDFEVVEAPDGRRAMAALKLTSFALVVLDLMLPESSGYDVLEFMRVEELNHIPVLVMSARTLPEDRAQAEELGAKRYLTKPFSRAEFTQAVVSAVRKGSGF
ncbi:MAG: response regulator [Proteobacteria bacterium]|nr:response regulator [Cystobacterineae bacterium]MCL2258391.1 response regulator [Cystobacterineae bacterium]MCL2315097.1 response regulator [Pseudomonadota bacterium]